MKFVELLNKCVIPISLLAMTGTMMYTSITYNNALVRRMNACTESNAARDENTAFNGTAED